jgi:hypothetical protein
MFAPNAYRIRFATAEDADTLRSLAERNSSEPLVGRVLIGQYDGTAAALSLHDGRVVADSSGHTGALVANLRSRAGAIRAFEATPSLRDRLRAAFAAYHGGSTVATTSLSHDGHAEDEPMPMAA